VVRLHINLSRPGRGGGAGSPHIGVGLLSHTQDYRTCKDFVSSCCVVVFLLQKLESALLPRNNSHRHEFTVVSLLYRNADRDTAQDRKRPRTVHHRSTVHPVASDNETLLPKKFAGSCLRRRNFAGSHPMRDESPHGTELPLSVHRPQSLQTSPSPRTTGAVSSLAWERVNPLTRHPALARLSYPGIGGR
jgi:hypothetical protein